MDSQLCELEFRDRAHKICSQHLGGAWSRISPSEMSFTPVTGGMSNLLFCCSLPESAPLSNGEPSQVLLRLYGEASRNRDMSLQVQIFELLSKRELGPRLYSNFDDGRLEEFLPAGSLTNEELRSREISAIIARKLATVHSLDVPNMDKNNTWIINRFNEWLSFIDDHRDLPEYPDGFLRESTKKVANSLLAIDFAKEIRCLSKIFEGTKSPLVFSHNDLHQGNILLTKPTRTRSNLDKRVILIDFEYCSFNYRGYDIANHFIEWCFEYDTPEYPHFSLHMDRFPSKDTQREFIRNYLDQRRRLSSKISYDDIDHKNNNYKSYDDIKFSNNNHCLKFGKATALRASEFDKEVDSIMNEVVPFCMAANLFWTMWCIKSAFSLNIKFGYWEHAMTRWKIYSNLKQTFSLDRASKRTPLATTVANGHSVPLIAGYTSLEDQNPALSKPL